MVKIVQKDDSTENAEREKAVATICWYLEDSVQLHLALSRVQRAGPRKSGSEPPLVLPSTAVALRIPYSSILKVT